VKNASLGVLSRARAWSIIREITAKTKRGTKKMFHEEEIKKILDDSTILLRAVGDCEKIYPGLRPSTIAKILVEYQTRLKDAFGVGE
jgi:hypothetical protein